MSGIDKRPCALIAAQDAGLRAALARLVRRAGYGFELADTPRRAQEIAQTGIDLAIVAPARFGGPGLALIRELAGSAGRLALVAEDAGETAELARLAPRAHVAAAEPLDERALFDWLTSSGPVGAAPPTAAPEAELVQLDGAVFDRGGRVFRNTQGHEVALSRAEFAALAAFVESPGRALSREQLRSAAFGEELDAYDRSIDMLVSRLRRKIEPDPKQPRLIVTVAGVGYRLAVRPKKLAPSDAAEPATGAAATPPAGVERRQLTVLACGIPGLAGLSEELDPEDIETLVARLGRVCSETVERWGGRLASFQSDSLVAHFGYPMAHEDDAERAIRAALDLRERLAEMDGLRPPLRPRLGIATGAAVVGGFAAGDAATALPAALGEAPRTAGWLEKSAKTGTLVIDNNTRRHAGRGFAYQALAPVLIDGIEQPARAWRVLGQVSHAGRFAAQASEGLTHFVDRDEEIALLERRWRLACAGAGQVLLVLGEPGIGKSRLAAEFERSLGAEEHVRMRCFGSPYHTASPLFPILRQLERTAGLAPADSIAQKHEKLRVLLGATAEAEGSLPLLAQLLSVPHPGESELLELTPQQRKEMTFTMLQGLAERQTAARPVAMLWEDAQWFDGLTLEFLALEIERAMRRKTLMIITARPGFQPPWADLAHVRQLTLSRLDHASSEELIGHVADGNRISEAVRRSVVERADGIPLFLEELTKEELREAPRPPARGEVPKIPETLEGLLLARIDGLGEQGKRVAQIGAVIGRSFSYELLRLVEAEPGLDAALARLTESELVFCRGAPPETSYVFRHALVQDAAYASLPRRRRRELHARVAQALEERFPDIVEMQPELLAHHHRKAGNWENAIDHLLRAAERALLRSAAADAQAQIAQSIELLPQLPDNGDRRRRELTAQMLLHRVAVMLSGRTSPAAAQALQRARQLCEALDDEQRLQALIFGQWYMAWSGALYRQARDHAEALMNWAKRHQSPAVETFAEYAVALCLLNAGSLEQARRHFQRAHALNHFDALPGASLPGYWAEGIVRVSSLLQFQICLFLLGRFREAEKVAREAEVAEQLMSQSFGRAIGRLLASRNHALRRDPHKLLHTTAALCEAGYPDFSGHAMVYRGWALSMTGEPAEGRRLARAGVEQVRAIGYRTWHSHMSILTAECEWRAGDAASALRTLAAGEAEVAETGECFLLAELHRLRGEIYWATRRRPAAAERSFGKAVEVARGQAAQLLELRAATSLARLWIETGRGRDARALLVPMIDAIEDSPNLADFTAAQAALEPGR
jgi:class 3 adenylate cyclase/tetratricopeptide (TPR) repeat protein